MSSQLTPKQVLALHYLIHTREEPAISEFKLLETSERKSLEKAGLIELQKRERIHPNKRKTYPQYIVLTDKAWDWVSKNYNAQLPRAKNTLPNYEAILIEALLKTIGANLELRGISLADFLQLQEKKTVDSESTVSAVTASINLEEKIREAYLKASDGSYNVRVRLSELRQHLANLPQAEIDKILGDMELDEKLVLMPLNDPQAIRDEDEKAAIDVGGNKRHILYMKG